MKNLKYLFSLFILTSCGNSNSQTEKLGDKEKRKTTHEYENIVAVFEEVNGTWNYCYLTKSGKIVGRDSVYFFDNSFDCESEGFIRFRDKETDKAGMFNRNGEVAIPAIYNDLTKVRNGMIIGLMGAKKKYWHKDSECNHFIWKGGKEVLIDTLNNILIDNFTYDNNLNFFTLEITQTTHSDPTRKSFLTKKGTYYSFVEFEKEFKQWLMNDLLVNLTIEKLIESSYDSITWWSSDGWTKTDKQQFITNNFSILQSSLSYLLNSECDFSISINGLNPFMYVGKAFEKYFTNCGESKEWIYPVMNIVIYLTDKNKYFTQNQNHYDFLRTDNGYKLISVTIRNETNE